MPLSVCALGAMLCMFMALTFGQPRISEDKTVVESWFETYKQHRAGYQMVRGRRQAERALEYPCRYGLGCGGINVCQVQGGINNA